MRDKPKKYTGSVHSPFSIQINPDYVDRQAEEIKRLRSALRRVMHWQSSVTIPASIKEEAENLLLEQEE